MFLIKHNIVIFLFKRYTQYINKYVFLSLNLCVSLSIYSPWLLLKDPLRRPFVLSMQSLGIITAYIYNIFLTK